MKREILLLDVTAMDRGHVCVAGWDVARRTHARLHQPATTRWLVKQLGDLAPGDLIRVDWRPRRSLDRPHVEDGIWDPDSLAVIDRYSLDRVRTLLNDSTFDSPQAAFGEPWQAGANENHAWQPGRGERSLATIRARSLRSYRRGEEVRMELVDAVGSVWRGIPLQDLRVRLHRESCEACRLELPRNVEAEFGGADLLVRVGLTRPYSPDERPPACWLQVTNVFARTRAHFR